MTDQERQRRMDRARFWIRAEIAIGVVVSIGTWFLFVAASGVSGGFGFEPSLVERLIPWINVAGPLVGLLWMVRLSRPRVETGERDWRYRGL
jgi:hypothetical protein